MTSRGGLACHPPPLRTEHHSWRWHSQEKKQKEEEWAKARIPDNAPKYKVDKKGCACRLPPALPAHAANPCHEAAAMPRG